MLLSNEGSVRGSLEELKALKELKQLKELKENSGKENNCFKIIVCAS
jgi:hypothetical protein